MLKTLSLSKSPSSRIKIEQFLSVFYKNKISLDIEITKTFQVAT